MLFKPTLIALLPLVLASPAPVPQASSEPIVEATTYTLTMCEATGLGGFTSYNLKINECQNLLPIPNLNAAQTGFMAYRAKYIGAGAPAGKKCDFQAYGKLDCRDPIIKSSTVDSLSTGTCQNTPPTVGTGTGVIPAVNLMGYSGKVICS